MMTPTNDTNRDSKAKRKDEFVINDETTYYEFDFYNENLM